MAHVSTEGTNEDLGPLEERLATVSDLHSAASVLAWDRQTYMTGGGVRGRAEQLASLARLAHEMCSSHRKPAGSSMTPASGSQARTMPPPSCASPGASAGGRLGFPRAPGGRNLARHVPGRAGLGHGHIEPWDAFWGQRYATVKDPDGNHVDLFAPL